MANLNLKSLSKAIASNKVVVILIFLFLAFLLYRSKILEGNTTKSVVKGTKNMAKDTKDMTEKNADKVNKEFKY